MQFLQVAQSGTLAMNEQTKQLERAGRTVYKFGFGESPFLPPETVRTAFQNANTRKDYTPVRGLPELRERIAEFHSEIDGYPIDSEQIMVAPGTKPLLYNLMMAFQNANVFLPAPAWVSYAPQAHIAGHNVFQIPTTFADRWRVTPATLDSVLTTHGNTTNLMVLNYPGNPDGLGYTRSELVELTTVLRKHQVWVIADEIYGLLHHTGQHISLASVYPERTIVTTGLSKWCGAGGWRLGALILPDNAPSELESALVGLASETYSCAAAPVQEAAESAYILEPHILRYIESQRHILRAIGSRIHSDLAALGIAVHLPEGGFYLLLDFSPFAESLRQHSLTDDASLCAALLADTGVALLPGSACGMSAAAYTARLAYVDFDGDAALQDIDSLANAAAFVERHARHMLEGIQRLGAWLNTQKSSS